MIQTASSIYPGVPVALSEVIQWRGQCSSALQSGPCPTPRGQQDPFVQGHKTELIKSKKPFYSPK